MGFVLLVQLVRFTWGTSQGEDKSGARDKILNTKIARQANIPPCSSCPVYLLKSAAFLLAARLWRTMGLTVVGSVLCHSFLMICRDLVLR